MPKEGELRVTLDACIIYRLALCDTLLHIAEMNVYLPIWSREILDEVYRASRKTLSPAKIKGLSNRVDRMNETFPEAIFEGSNSVVSQLRHQLSDEFDAHVVATAIVSKSEFIVTENLKDFPGKVLLPLGIQAVSFDKFMEFLFSKEPVAVVSALNRLVESKSNPPLTLREHLLQLESYSPNFNRNIREHLRNSN
jgi:predicted nucleic acid-binding protein